MATKRVDGFLVKNAGSYSHTKISQAISTLASEKKLTHSASCPIILFSRAKKGGAKRSTPVAVQRCEGRSLVKPGGKKKFAARVRAHEVCRGKNHRFKRCR